MRLLGYVLAQSTKRTSTQHGNNHVCRVNQTRSRGYVLVQATKRVQVEPRLWW